jgi:anhydro-N-acetylmuramic acid kinase
MLEEIESKSERLIIGLISGTSADGIDAALVRVLNSGEEAQFEIIRFETLRFSKAVQQKILKAQGATGATARDVVLLSSYLGELFSHAAKRLCEGAGIGLDAIDLIGLHGQTLYHHPDPVQFPGAKASGSLQICNPAVVAERTGVTVISDFRSRDMAVGGQGAPLVPYLDFALYRHRSRGRIALNIGGIANVTGIPANKGIESVVAFDTGPGNCLIDQAVVRFTQGKRLYDENGEWAKSGTVNREIISSLMAHPYLQKTPPKSLDKEAFGPVFLEDLLKKTSGLSPADWVATLSAFTVQSIAMGVMEHLLQSSNYEELIVCGGGAKNPYLVSELQKALPKLLIVHGDEYTIPAKAKEAVLMAYLANETLVGRPANVPSATGASHPVVLGSITPGKNAWRLT